MAQVQIRMTQAGQGILNVLNFRKPGATYVSADIQTLADEVGTWWNTSYAPALSAAVGLVEIVAKGLTSETDYLATATTPTTFVGGVAGEALPNNCAFALKFGTGFSGRSRHGRVFVPGIREADSTLSSLALGVAEDFRDLFAELIDLADGVGWKWVVLSRIAAGEFRPVAIAYDILSVVFSDLVIDSMRSRKPTT